jgi:DNA-binding transcriptional ArsR family regulator
MSGRLPDLTQLDRVIHEPARLMIVVTLLGVEEADFLYLQRECGLTQGNLSSHLSKLEEAGYVNIEKTFKGKFPMTICRLTEAGEAAFNGYSAILSGALRNGGRATRKRPA